MQHFVLAILYGIIGQVLSFIQLQASIKWGWTEKWGLGLLFLGLPISWSFMHSVKNFILAFDGSIWPSRLGGFGIGVIVFSLMGWYLFKEPFTPKTGVCLLLSLAIILVQILWK